MIKDDFDEDASYFDQIDTTRLFLLNYQQKRFTSLILLLLSIATLACKTSCKTLVTPRSEGFISIANCRYQTTTVQVGVLHLATSWTRISPWILKWTIKALQVQFFADSNIWRTNPNLPCTFCGVSAISRTRISPHSIRRLNNCRGMYSRGCRTLSRQTIF